MFIADLHPPYDYALRKRTLGSAGDDLGGSSGDFDALYHQAFSAGPQGTQFGADGEHLPGPSRLTRLSPPSPPSRPTSPIPPPPSKKQRKTPKPPVPQHPIARQALILLRRDLQLYDPDSDPTHAEVPDIFGGELTVEDYTLHIYPEAVSTLGVPPEVSYNST